MPSCCNCVNRPILRVDGPHSAPSEHYCNYNTCMIVGAGIGLTPCSSILTALLKYRWSKNFKPVSRDTWAALYSLST